MRAVPAVRYALGVVGVSAAVFLARGLLPGVSITAMLPLLLGAIVAMAALAIFAGAVASPRRHRSTIGVVFLWAVCTFVITFMLFTVTAVAVGWPAAWARLILPESAAESSLVDATGSEGAPPDGNVSTGADNGIAVPVTPADEVLPESKLPSTASESEGALDPNPQNRKSGNATAERQLAPPATTGNDKAVEHRGPLEPLNVAGTWASHDGSEFQIEQIGDIISFRVFQSGAQTGDGRGSIDQRNIHQTYRFEGGQMECPAKLEPNNDEIKGVCHHDSGLRAFHLTRIRK